MVGIMEKPFCSANGTASPIPNSNTASFTCIDFNLFCRFDELSTLEHSTLCHYHNWLAQDNTLVE